jgi:hypothetical protein
MMTAAICPPPRKSRRAIPGVFKGFGQRLSAGGSPDASRENLAMEVFGTVGYGFKVI